MEYQRSFEATLFRDESTRKRKAPELARRMIAVLAAKRSWVPRREFAEKHGFSADGRECRLGCMGAHGRIIFGRRGYKLTVASTLEEVQSCLRMIASQIASEQEKHKRISMRAHIGIHSIKRAMA